jgi:hypothetical protein
MLQWSDESAKDRPGFCLTSLFKVKKRLLGDEMCVVRKKEFQVFFFENYILCQQVQLGI